MADKKIKVAKEGRFKDSAKVQVVINGARHDIATDQEVTVPEEVLEALANADIAFTEVAGADGDGVSTASATTVTDTANRDVPAHDPAGEASGSGEVPELGEEASGGGVSGARGQSVSVEPASKEAMFNAEGQGISANADAIAAAGMSDSEDEAGAKAGDGADATPEPGPLDGSVEKLKEYLATVTDTAELDKLEKSETSGKTRASALDAIAARRKALGE